MLHRPCCVPLLSKEWQCRPLQEAGRHVPDGCILKKCQAVGQSHQSNISQLVGCLTRLQRFFRCDMVFKHSGVTTNLCEHSGCSASVLPMPRSKTERLQRSSLLSHPATNNLHKASKHGRLAFLKFTMGVKAPPQSTQMAVSNGRGTSHAASSLMSFFQHPWLGRLVCLNCCACLWTCNSSKDNQRCQRFWLWKLIEVLKRKMIQCQSSNVRGSKLELWESAFGIWAKLWDVSQQAKI